MKKSILLILTLVFFSSAQAQKKKKVDRKPSGFAKPTKISDALCDFLDIARGELMARTEVTREINTYIRAHKLQDPTNGRIIKADNKLRKLLNLNNLTSKYSIKIGLFSIDSSIGE